METHVLVGKHAKEFIRSLAPEPRRAVLQAIKALPRGDGDIKQLEGRLAPYWRLRVKRIRVVYTEKSMDGQRIILCFYANFRPVVYQLVEQLLVSSLVDELRDF